MMTKLRFSTLVLMLAMLAEGAVAASGSNQLFLEIWNGGDVGSGKSYIKELGISLDDFLAKTDCYQKVIADLSGDSNLSALKTGGALPSTAVWSVLGYNDNWDSLLVDAGEDPQSEANHTGTLTTVAGADPTEPGMYPSFTDVETAMAGHFSSLGGIGSELFAESDTGYYLNGWGPSLNNSVGFTQDLLVGGGSLPMYFLTTDSGFNDGVVGRGGAPLGTWSFDGDRLSFTSGKPVPDACPRPTTCDLPWGGQIGEGEFVDAYQTEFSANCAAVKETRLCAGGQLSGSYTHQSCSAPRTCQLPWGGQIGEGESVEAYQTAVNADCAAVKETRTCGSGQLTGSYSHQTCAAPKSCQLPWGGSVASGQSVDAYQAELSDDCAAIKETRSCQNGALSGSYAKPSCAAPKPCDLPWGGQIASGQSVIAYQADKHPYCEQAKEARACVNGALSGLYAFPACSVSAYGPYLQFQSPNGGESLKAKTAERLNWTSVNIKRNQRLDLYFSKDGGATWKRIKKGVRSAGQVKWRPLRSQVTDRGMLAVCLPQSRTNLPKCDKSDAAFSVVR